MTGAICKRGMLRAAPDGHREKAVRLRLLQKLRRSANLTSARKKPFPIWHRSRALRVGLDTLFSASPSSLKRSLNPSLNFPLKNSSSKSSTIEYSAPHSADPPYFLAFSRSHSQGRRYLNTRSPGLSIDEHSPFLTPEAWGGERYLEHAHF